MVHILEIHNSTLKSLLFHHIFTYCAFLPFAVFVFWIGNCRIWVVMSFMYLHRFLYFFLEFLMGFFGMLRYECGQQRQLCFYIYRFSVKNPFREFSVQLLFQFSYLLRFAIHFFRVCYYLSKRDRTMSL